MTSSNGLHSCTVLYCIIQYSCEAATPAPVALLDGFPLVTANRVKVLSAIHAFNRTRLASQIPSRVRLSSRAPGMIKCKLYSFTMQYVPYSVLYSLTFCTLYCETKALISESQREILIARHRESFTAVTFYSAL